MSFIAFEFLRQSRRRIHVALCACALALGCTPGVAVRETLSQDIGELARQAADDLINKKDPMAIARYFANEYVEHDPARGGGIEALRTFANSLASQPSVRLTVHRTIVDRDLVALHGKLEGLQGTPTLIVMDLFRFSDGKIVEHWGASQPEAPRNPSGRTQLDGETVVTDREATEPNREVVNNLITALFIHEKVGRLDEFIDSSKYLQHNPRIGDGAEALKSMLTGIFNSAPSGRLHKPHRILAQGNFVMVQIESRMGPNTLAIYDLFRLENGKIVEHWDVISPVPPSNQWLNKNGPF